MVTYNLSELFEIIADEVPERVAVATPARRLTYAQLDERANRLAHHLASASVGPGDHVGLHMKNGTEYLEGMLASFKLRAVPVNINYRYVEEELTYLYRYMDVAAAIVHREFAPSVAAIASRIPALRHVVAVEDGAGVPLPEGWERYDEAIAAASPQRDFSGRSSDDVYCACTGGTTGMPKGVLWSHEDIFFASLGGVDTLRGRPTIGSPEQIRERVTDDATAMLILPPLMHVSAHWAAFIILYGAGKVVLLSPGPFEPAAAWRAIEAEQVSAVTLVGNAMARPLIDHFGNHRCDASTLRMIGSGGALFSPSTKERIHELLPDVIVHDGFGSTETGVAGQRMTGNSAEARQEAAFTMDAMTTVLDDDLRPLEPGDGRTGQLARRGHIPLGYYNDPEKTAATFVEKDGVRWVLPGDMASIEADGSIVLRGRGSVSINTGGEKVFAEEVETVLVAYPAVDDVVVVGVPDEHWGERVVAVVQPKRGAAIALEDLQRYGRKHLAGYKIPRALVTVERVSRSPVGKPDYGWARDLAIARLGLAG